jgi:chloramphenicol 3-O-phosphotransferase
MNRTRVMGQRARLKAASGGRAAVAEVAEMLASLEGSPWTNIRIDAFIDAAEAVASLGEVDVAAGYLADALRLAREKENLALVGQLTTRLEELRVGPVIATKR